ncbi:hypothetical protein GUJ93_ZPchr0002g24438 [Zizania palustris]|uniref:Uncharacterized protein n=1 Tax=Zizania palustris TaxID=103762 RepID=A0A8J5SBB0_ZIZPA|nr:hypothetical protein GUJ93_ZPchr0002g24438 [Zizania palustris]
MGAAGVAAVSIVPRTTPRHVLAATAAKKPEEIAAPPPAPPATESGKGAEKAEKPKEEAKEPEAESSEMKHARPSPSEASRLYPSDLSPPTNPPSSRDLQLENSSRNFTDRASLQWSTPTKRRLWKATTQMENTRRDVDEGYKSCSVRFRSSLKRLFEELLMEFTVKGADCDNFLAEKVKSGATGATADTTLSLSNREERRKGEITSANSPAAFSRGCGGVEGRMAAALALVSQKLKKVLETQTDNPDLLASLGALSTYGQNTLHPLEILCTFYGQLEVSVLLKRYAIIYIYTFLA